MTALERARERETIRYYAAWLESRRGYLSPRNPSRDHSFQPHNDEATQKISRDKALVAFAQLGSLRLNAKRGLVTLITTSTSYILAEATQTVSLLPGGQYADGDELWFGTASIPRSQGISEQVLDAQPYTAQSPDGQEYTTPAVVIEDVTQDPRFSNKGYAGGGVSFYAGVPIVSQNGFTIGVFNVTDDKPRPGGLTSSELKFMQDMACTVTDHLENIRNDSTRHRGERMILGLGAFSEGHISLDTDSDTSHPGDDARSQTFHTSFVRSTFKGLTISDTTPKAPLPTPLGEEPPSIAGQHVAEKESFDSIQTSEEPPSQVKVVGADAEHDDMPIGLVRQNSLHSLEDRRTFIRAANILRQCTDSDGVVFFDASSASMSDIHQGSFSAHRTYSNDSNTSSEEGHYSSGGSSDDHGQHTGGNANQSGLKHRAELRSSHETSKVKNCELLGSSFQASSKIQTSDMVLKEVEMRRFLRRYPRGMVMHFTTDGSVSSSEEGSARDRVVSKVLPARSDRRRAIARDLIKVVPGARSVVWLPLWDFSRSRWAAGCFIWTSRPGRLLDAQEDLIYMRAFASTIMSEINRSEAIASDHAKTSFVANISHELRSPLHGILGSIEFLHGTAIDTFQASMITTVETCGKTLLDTVNHVLDYSKLSKRPEQGSRRSSRRTEERSSNLEEDIDLSRLVEEVVESVYAGQTFRSTGAFHASEGDEIPVASSFREQPSVRELAHRTQSKFSGDVQVILDVERLDSWFVRTEPGAIRRIVMNLFGNALKYTENGWVCISLSSTQSSDESQLGFRVTVTDTGKGMSENFIRHHAWKPFSQEDSFASGTGLGLSIVRQITDSLGGETALSSQKDKGTVVSVTVTVPRATTPLDESHDLNKAVSQRVNGSRLCLLKPDVKELHGLQAEANARAEDNFIRTASSWFGMDVFSSKQVKGVTADFFLYMEPPPTEYLLKEHGLGTKNMDVPLIVISPNAFESATLRKDTQKLQDLGRTLEIISQPCGPAKFAKAIERCLDRNNSNAPPDLDSPSISEASRQETIPAATEANEQTVSSVHKGQVPQVTEDQQVTRRRDSHSPSGLSSPSSDTTTDSLVASMDARLLSGTDTDSGSKSGSSNQKTSNKVESKGPVLLVDDNEVNLKLLVAFVRKAKYAYETATDGSQALNMYKEASRDSKRAFKAIVMDIQMPVMDGITSTREIRSFESKNRTDHPAVIMALTGLADESTKSECMQAGMNHFLAKPVKFKGFLELLKQC